MQTTTEWNNNKILKKQTIVLALAVRLQWLLGTVGIFKGAQK